MQKRVAHQVAETTFANRNVAACKTLKFSAVQTKHRPFASGKFLHYLEVKGLRSFKFVQNSHNLEALP